MLEGVRTGGVGKAGIAVFSGRLNLFLLQALKRQRANLGPRLYG